MTTTTTKTKVLKMHELLLLKRKDAQAVQSPNLGTNAQFTRLYMYMRACALVPLPYTTTF